jgi:hypothetical protein
VRKQRLKKLAVFLDTLPKKVFDLAGWTRLGSGIPEQAIQYGALKKTLKKGLSQDQAIECGFAACAVGWACTIPAFQKAGLIFDVEDRVPRFEGERNWFAVAEFFDLEMNQAHRLFMDGHYRTKAGTVRKHVKPQEVAARIRELIAQA